MYNRESDLLMTGMLILVERDEARERAARWKAVAKRWREECRELTTGPSHDDLIKEKEDD